MIMKKIKLILLLIMATVLVAFASDLAAGNVEWNRERGSGKGGHP